MHKQKDIFISHSSKEKAIAEELCNYFESNGLSCWIAPRDVRAGEAYSSEIVTGIENSGLFFLLLTENANKSDDVTKEVDRAVKNKKKIIPFRLGDFVLNKELEYYLSKSHWIVGGSRPDKLYNQLLVQIQQSLGIEIEKEEKSATKAVLQTVSPQQLTLVINEEAIEIPNSYQIFVDHLAKSGANYFMYLNDYIKVSMLCEGLFNMLTKKVDFNQFFTKSLISEILSENSRAEHFFNQISKNPNWELARSNRNFAINLLSEEFAGITGKEIGDLAAIGVEIYSPSKHMRYVEKVISIVSHTLDLMTFLLLSELWDYSQGKLLEFDNEETRQLVSNRFDTNYDLTTVQQLEILFGLLSVFTNQQNNLEFPIPELSHFIKQQEVKEELFLVCNALDRICLEVYDIKDCYHAEQYLVTFLKYFKFLHKYKMISVKQIDYRQIKNFDPAFVHRYITIGNKSSGKNTKEIGLKNYSSYSNSILIYKGDDFRNSFNLFPFVIDINALILEEGANICYFRRMSLDSKNLEYLSLAKNDPVIFEKTGVLKQKKDISELLSDVENTKLLNMECVYDRFMEARRCILNEISFDDI
jgi:hypothetical protein